MKPGISVMHRRDIIKGAVKRWDAQYDHCEPSYKIGPADKKEAISEIRARLRKLDLEKCSVDDVHKAIGVDGWASNDCYICEADAPVTVGLQSQFSDNTVVVCKSCLEAALKAASVKPRL